MLVTWEAVGVLSAVLTGLAVLHHFILRLFVRDLFHQELVKFTVVFLRADLFLARHEALEERVERLERSLWGIGGGRENRSDTADPK